MDKRRAEAILGLREPYDYSTLRETWRRLCSDFHPDKSQLTGMNQSYSDEALKDINEAYNYLKPLVESGETITPGEYTRGSNRRTGYDAPSENDWKAHEYSTIMLEMFSAKTSSDYESLVTKLGIIGDYYDAPALMQECFLRAMALKKEEEAEKFAKDVILEELTRAQKKRDQERQEQAMEEEYTSARNVMWNATSVKEYRDAEEHFIRLGDYLDSRQKAEYCRNSAKKLLDERNAELKRFERLEQSLDSVEPETAYRDALTLSNKAVNVNYYIIAMIMFEALGNYKDAADQTQRCRGLVERQMTLGHQQNAIDLPVWVSNQELLAFARYSLSDENMPRGTSQAKVCLDRIEHGQSRDAVQSAINNGMGWFKRNLGNKFKQ